MGVWYDVGMDEQSERHLFWMDVALWVCGILTAAIAVAIILIVVRDVRYNRWASDVCKREPSRCVLRVCLNYHMVGKMNVCDTIRDDPWTEFGKGDEVVVK